MSRYAGWGWWSVPFWLIALFMLQFFRDPPRDVPHDPEAVLSPADGRIVTVERARDPYLDRDALKISVFMNVFNVHSNRSPVDGEVRKTLVSRRQRSSMRRSPRLRWKTNALRSGSAPTGGADVTCVQVAGLIARRILCYAKRGQTVSRAAALRLHPLRFARGRLPAGRRDAARSASATRCTADAKPITGVVSMAN